MSSGTVDSAPRAASIRSNTAWNLLGLGIYSICQWWLIAAIARSDAEKAGTLAIGLSIATPVFMLLGLNLSVVQAVEDKENLSSHLAIRVITLPIGLAIAVALSMVVFGASMVPIVVACCIARWIETISNSAHGVFLAKRSLKPLGVGLALRGAVGVSLGLLAWTRSGSVVQAAFGMAAGWLFGLVAVELPAARRLVRSPLPANRTEIRRLLRRGLPLGLDSGANSMTHQGPRMLIGGLEGNTALGRYLPVVQLAQYATVVAGAVGAALLSQLADYWRSGQIGHYRSLVLRLLLYAVPVSAGFSVLTGLFGPWVVARVLGATFVDRPLIWSMGVLVGVITVQRLLARALQAVGSFGTVLKIDLAVMAVSLLAAAVFIRAFGLVGATVGMLCGFAIGSITVVVQLQRLTADRTLGSPTHKERSGG